jgi:hypothetical protein
MESDDINGVKHFVHDPTAFCGLIKKWASDPEAHAQGSILWCHPSVYGSVAKQLSGIEVDVRVSPDMEDQFMAKMQLRCGCLMGVGWNPMT